MKVTVLGSGTSTGVPIIGCTCIVCKSDNPKNQRLRSSVYVEVDGKSILIDTSPDLRQQALKYNLNKIDAVLYTHEHADHVHGIDDLRVFNVIQASEIPLYGTEKMVSHLHTKFPYIFSNNGNVNGFVPKLRTVTVDGIFDCEGIKVTMVPCCHGKSLTNNYRIGNFAWLTDTNGIPDESMELLQGLEVLFLDGLRYKKHDTHFNFEQALAVSKKISAKKTYLIHLTHDYEHDEVNAQLPTGIELAYDGLVWSNDNI